MEESLLCNLRLQQELIESFQESSINYLTNLRKRGKLAHHQLQTSKISHTVYIDIRDTAVIEQYPYSAVGVIRWYMADVATFGIGAIIGKNLVITSTAMIDKARLKQYKIGFTALNKKEELFCIKKHPYEVYKWSYQNQATQEEVSEIEFIILQFDSEYDLQSDSGTIGVNFKWDYFCGMPLLINIQKRQNEIFLSVLPIHQNNLKQKKQYHLSEKDKVTIGSLVLDAYGGQFYLRGFHIFQSQGRGQFLKLTQTQYKRFKNMTYKGLELDLSHNSVKLKNLAYLSMVDRGKIKFIDLTYSSIKQEAFKIFTNLDCELIGAYLGTLFEIKDIIKSMIIAYNNQQKPPGFQNNFNQNLITGNGLIALKDCNFKYICKLSLDENKLGAKGMKYLSYCDMKMLQYLSLRDTQLNDCASLHLSKCNWPFLSQLIIDKNRVGQEGIRYITSASWRRLTFFGINSNRIRLQGLNKLMYSDWPIVKKITAIKNQIGKNRTYIKAKLCQKYNNSYFV